MYEDFRAIGYIIDQLCKFFDENDCDLLEDRLKKMSAQYIGENSVLSSLLYCFMCNGYHLNLYEISLLVNTVLECYTDFDQNPELFSCIILSYSQFHWIDELILIKLENLLRRKLQDKLSLRNLLKNIMDRSVKLIVAAKLVESESSINEKLFSTILSLLPSISDDKSFLEHMNLSEWSLELKKNYWHHDL